MKKIVGTLLSYAPRFKKERRRSQVSLFSAHFSFWKEKHVDGDEYGGFVEMILTRENRITGKKSCLTATLSTTNIIGIDLRSNQQLIN
jgi:hypothetical protein